VWEAVRFERVMAAGRTRPLLLECSRETSAQRERARFVTKAIGLPEVQPFSLAHEFLGSRLAIMYGLAAPAAHIVSISDAFIAAAEPDLAGVGLHPKSGLAVGTEFIPDLMPFPVPVRLAEDEVVGAAEVYVFDLMTQNPDRSAASPNCGRAGQRVVPYDFETAFSFRFALSRVDAWRVAGLPFPKKHLFYGAIKRFEVDWRAVFGRFRSVSLASLADACSTIPDAWTDIGREVHAHLTSVHEHWSEFEREITTSLGGSL
jgi:hypothetical protein